MTELTLNRGSTRLTSNGLPTEDPATGGSSFMPRQTPSFSGLSGLAAPLAASLAASLAMMAAVAACRPHERPAAPEPVTAARVNAASEPRPSPAPSAPRGESTSQVPPITPAEPPVVPPSRLPEVPAAIAASLDADDRAKLEVAASVCPAIVMAGDGPLRVGCRTCPPFTAANGPDGTIVVGPRVGTDFYELEAVIPGSFSATGADELAAVFSGCEPPSENLGGTLLVARHHDNVWASRSYRSGLHPEACVPFQRTGGPTLLVCRWRTAHQGIARETVDTYDFSLGSEVDVEAGRVRFVELITDATSACMDGQGASGPPVTAGRIDALRVEPAAGGSAARLVVEARAVRSSRTPTFLARCRQRADEGARANPRYVDVAAGLALQRLRLVFTWSGAAFEATLETRRALDALAPVSE